MGGRPPARGDMLLQSERPLSHQTLVPQPRWQTSEPQVQGSGLLVEKNERGVVVVKTQKETSMRRKGDTERSINERERGTQAHG